ncbi:MAG: ABC transporter ATP-binding protein [Bacillota bacterium]|jgi:ATP-binding cassette subfamily B protein
MRVIARVYSDYVRRSWPLFAIAVLLVVCETVMNVYMPQLSKAMVDAAVGTDGVEAASRVLLWKSLVYTVLGLIRSVVIFFEIYLFERVAENVSLNVRHDLYDKVQNLSFAFHNRSRTGDLMSRMTSDVYAVRDMCGFGVSMLAYDVFIIVSVVGWMIAYNPVYALASLFSMPLLAVFAIRYSGRSGPVFRSIQDQVASMTAAVQESVSGIRVVKAFAQEDQERDRFGKANDAVLRDNLKAAKINAFYHPAMDFCASLGTVGVIWCGGRLYAQGALTAGDITAFLSYLWMLIWPVRQIAAIIRIAQRGIAGGQRVFEILDARDQIANRSDAEQIAEVAGHVQFCDVDFSYDSEEKVLDGFSLDIPPGSTVGILGTTGSGKSTIGALIPRFHDVDSGAILIDGKDIRDLDIHSLRRQVGIVPQDTFLFSTSIRENIAYYQPDIELERVIAAAKAAQIHDFIESLPQGYDTVVGERGVGLSGGQRQRVAIARALVMDPKILILDDSTASVDAETESMIQESLREIAKGRTTIIISQKVSSVRYADRIVVLRNGKIIEQGTHAELYALGGFYRQLCDAQAMPLQPAREGVEI